MSSEWSMEVGASSKPDEEEAITKPEKVLPDLCRNFVIAGNFREYKAKDVILYALGLGVSEDPLKDEDLVYTYENHPSFSTIPSFAAVLPDMSSVFEGLNNCPGMPEFNPMRLLHGEQLIKIFRPLPTEGKLRNVTKIKDVYDKKSGALVVVSTETYTVADDKLLCVNEASLFIRDIGGFGGKQQLQTKPAVVIDASRKPDAVFTKKTTENQALLYRLSGDVNPLHVDTDLAAIGGFKRPILHGLCSFGVGCFAIVQTICNNNAANLASIEGRFSSPVVPGNTLQVRIFKENPTKVLFNIVNVETNKECVSNGVALLRTPANL